MDRARKITAIYKEMAKKDRTFGCVYIIKDGDWYEYEVRETEWECVKLTYWDEYQVEYWDDYTRTNYLVSIIWHPVMIGNVIEYIRIWCEVFIEWQPIEDSTVFWRWRDYKTLLNNLIFNWYRADLPIDDQTDECIDYVYSLIKKS